jgi:hypothetical protein
MSDRVAMVLMVVVTLIAVDHLGDLLQTAPDLASAI